jgi:hypothetical protein
MAIHDHDKIVHEDEEDSSSKKKRFDLFGEIRINNIYFQSNSK